jgi:ammonia channel protein AmtB
MNIIQEHTMHSAGWALLHFLWQGALIGLALKITLAAMRNRSAQSRYLAGCVAMMLLALTPPATFLWLNGAPAAEPSATLFGAGGPRRGCD